MEHPRTYTIDPCEETHIHVERVINYLQCNHAIADRIRKLNPEWLERGTKLRGLHRKLNVQQEQLMSLIYCYPLGRAVRENGRQILDFIPKADIRKRGRRKFVTRVKLLQAIEWLEATA